jgi:hypothetical protein
MAFAYRDPRSGEQVTVEQAVRVPQVDDWAPKLGPAQVLCWGALRSGLLRHPLLVCRSSRPLTGPRLPP